MTEGIVESPPHKQRSSNLELYRIICMLMIVAHHFVALSGLNAVDGPLKADTLAPNSIYLYLFGMWGKVGINCFLMITGYFMCTSSITFRKFLKLYLWVIFYNIIIAGIFIACSREQITPMLILKLFPFATIHTNSFTSSFMVWWLFIPFLNVLINNLSIKQHILLISLLLVVCTVYSTIPNLLNYDPSPIAWFSTIYIIAAFIRKNTDKIYKARSTAFWGWVTFGLVIISMLSVVTLLIVGKTLGREMPQYYFVIDSCKPFALLVSVSSFLWFNNIKISYSKWINILGGASFGVLLIHSNSSAMRTWLWGDVFDCVGHYSLPIWQLIAYSIFVVLIIYVVCFVIDYLRLRCIEEPFFNWYDKKRNKIKIIWTTN